MKEKNEGELFSFKGLAGVASSLEGNSGLYSIIAEINQNLSRIADALERR